MGRKIKHVLVTYFSHHWIMAGIVVWFVLIMAPQLVVTTMNPRATSNTSPAAFMLMGMPLLFLSIMLVPQAKAQFAHARAALTPGFVVPHLIVLGGILLLLVILFPLTVAWCCRFDPLGTSALAAAIAASLIWSVHFNRMGGMVVGLGVFYSMLTTAGANWWLIQANGHRLIHATILVGCIGLLVVWLARLCRLREEMDDYQTTVQWRTARRSGTEVSEQRRIVAEQMRRSKVSSWISDFWLAGVGGYHGDSTPRLARLLRFGFGQPAELSGLFMSTWFFAITLFLANFGFAASGSTFGQTLFYMQMAMLFPGMFAGEWLAQRRPRVAVELLYPLSRRRLVDGLLAATVWNTAAFWLVMNAGLVLSILLTARERLHSTMLFMILLLTGSGAFGMAGLSLRTSVWPSIVKRLAVLMITMFLFQAPLLFWSFAREKTGDAPFLLAAAVMCGIGVVMIRLARQAWLEVELG